MADRYDVLQSTLIVALILGTIAWAADSAELAGIEGTLQAIEEYMTRSPAPWPDEWKQEYIETIRKATELHQDATHYTDRLEILRKGFGPYWESFKKTAEKSLFDVHRMRIRWYVEHLMGTNFPTDDERQKLRDQFTDIWNHAADSLSVQFPFLDANAVQAAKADELSICYFKIDAPLMPVYLRPMSEDQVGQIKQRWQNLRYARVDLWRGLGGSSTTSSESSDVPSSNSKRDYELTKESLSQLLGQVWMVLPQRPDYYLAAIENQAKALKHRVEVKQQAQSDQQRLEKERSRQLLQAEHISFLLAALLETSQCIERAPLIVRQEQKPVRTARKSAKGGGAYEVANASTEK